MDKSDYFIILVLVGIMVALLCNPPKTELPANLPKVDDEYSILIATDTLKNIAVLRLIRITGGGAIEIVTIDTFSIDANIRYMRVIVRGD